MIVPSGACRRIHGRKSLLSVISPMCTPMRSPAVALKVHVATWLGSEIEPVWRAPLINSVAKMPSEMLKSSRLSPPERIAPEDVALNAMPLRMIVLSDA